MEGKEIMITEDWDYLNDAQKRDLDAFRKKVSDAIMEAAKVFDEAHPELRLTFSFTSDALIRERHPYIFQSL